jgi:diguanylate cyclase (GGDEF)-like protein
MSVLAMLAWCGAAVSLWLGARRHAAGPARPGAAARGYRWLAAAAALYCAGLVVTQVAGGALSPASGLSFTDLPSLLALVAAALGIAALAAEDGSAGLPADPAAGRPPVLPGLADGYVTAVALLVIGWVTLFDGEFHRSGDQPGTFLVALVHPLADLAVLGALLPLAGSAWRRAALPYLALFAVATGDALAVGQRVSGGRPGVAAAVIPVAAAAAAAAAPGPRTGARWARRAGGAAGTAPSAVIAVLAASAAALVVIGYGLAGAPASGEALVVAGGAGVLVLAARVFMLVIQNGAVLRRWRESAAELRELAGRTSDLVLVATLGGVICQAGQAAEDYGYSPAALAGRRLLDFVHPGDRAAVVAAARLGVGAVPAPPAGQPGSAGRFPARVRAADGTWRHVEVTALRHQAPGDAAPAGLPSPGLPARMLVTVRDVSEQVALRQQVTHLTFHDGLTGLPNRAYLEERARDVLRRGAEGPAGRRVGVIFVDLDRFTAVNDSVGHGAGDLVLAQAARRLRATVPAHDTVARWGSDEFAVLVEDAAGAGEVAEIADGLAGAIAAEPFRVPGQEIALTASVGVAVAEADDPGLVLRNADVAMSRAKDGGGDRVEVYAAHMHADAVRKVEIVTDLRRAIADGDLALQYQPIVELATSRVTGAEALVRLWRGGRAVGARDFLGAAEESGLIVPLGERVLREACAQGAAWRRSAWQVGVSVNLSARQIAAPGFTAMVGAVLAETGLPARALTVEVNERVLLADDGLVIDRLADLHRLGVRLAIDDFGTGYASLAYLRQLPLDAIKIDPSFVAGLGRDDTLTLLTRTVVVLGRELGLQVIAEGIEQPRQLAALREMGCGHGQGFLVARPMAAPGVEALIRTAGQVVSECETTRVSG